MVDFNKEKISEYDYRKTIADQNYKIAKDNELLLQNSRELDLYKQKYNEIIFRSYVQKIVDKKLEEEPIEDAKVKKIGPKKDNNKH